ncbi:P-loop containing nucleoside triphosphate hydrolase protein, partial [Mycena olivaceomarginata]
VFLEAVQRNKGRALPLVLVANKCDRANERQVTHNEGLAKATSLGCEIIETSAKTGTNVDSVSTNIVRALRGKRDVMEASALQKKQRHCIIL